MADPAPPVPLPIVSAPANAFNPAVLARANVPALTVVAPAKVLAAAPLSVRVPEPLLMRLPVVPLTTPLIVVLNPPPIVSAWVVRLIAPPKLKSPAVALQV